MPIYEYRCAACGRKASIFFRSISSVDGNPACPSCGEHRLERRMSRVWSRRSADADVPEPSYEEGGVPFYGGDPSSYGDYGSYGGGDDYGVGDAPEDFSDEDVAAFARETRQMAAMMGEPLDTDLDTALRHIEGGADPDDVLGELDSRSSADSITEPGATGTGSNDEG